MALSTNDRELTEVLVQRDQHATIRSRALADLRVSWILPPRARPFDVVACFGRRCE
jgi:hypothetical protein